MVTPFITLQTMRSWMSKLKSVNVQKGEAHQFIAWVATQQWCANISTEPWSLMSNFHRFCKQISFILKLMNMIFIISNLIFYLPPYYCA
jgi:hypothetical protein